MGCEVGSAQIGCKNQLGAVGIVHYVALRGNTPFHGPKFANNGPRGQKVGRSNKKGKISTSN